MALDPIAELGRQFDASASDPGLTPRERMVKLRTLRDRVVDLVGQADRYIGNLHQLEESAAARDTRDVLRARELAGVRESLELDGVDGALLDEAALPTNAELDALAEEGLLGEAVAVIGGHPLGKFDKSLHPHGNHGEFSRTFHDEKKAPAVDKDGQPIDERYKDYFKHDPDAIVAHVDRLRPTRDDTPEHIAKARKNLNNAKKGLILKRKPLTVAENGDGTLSIIDGNSTHAALTAEGLTHLPVKIDHQVTDAGAAANDRVADEIATKASAAEKDVTPAISNVVQEAGGRMEGLEHRLKSRESIKSKIARKQEKYPGLTANKAGEKVKDSVRYTAVVPKEGYVQSIKDTQGKLAEAGYNVAESRNFWGGNDDYDGYHAILQGPDGTNVELQFHTDESLAAKKQLHPLFEQFRETTDSTQRYTLWKQMQAITAKTPKPEGVDTLGPTIASPSKHQAQKRHESFGYEG